MLKTKELWIEYMKKKKIKANKELLNADLALQNPDHFYNIYLKQGGKGRINKQKIEVKKEVKIIDEPRDYF